MTRAVIKFPLVHPLETQYGDGQDPDVAAILAMAADLFPEPGSTPVGWPAPSAVSQPVAAYGSRRRAPAIARWRPAPRSGPAGSAGPDPR